MTATDELRRLLDERGVEWSNVRNDGSESNFFTEWQFDGIDGRATATEWSAGNNLSMAIYRWSLTPEQAIAATLGSCNCSNSERTGTCRAVSMRERDKRPYLHDELVCSECGCQLAHEFGHVWQHYCPNCGRRVE